MKIGELARATATAVETIRHYEREGLLPPPPRTEGNYRVYGRGEVERLGFIRQCRGLDMSLDEIRRLLALKDAPPAEGADCGEVNGLLDEHIGHVAERLRELRQLEEALKALREACSQPGAAADCGILQQLARPASGGAVLARGSHLGHTHRRPAKR
jgi:Cd(II)/Pb(II)-responsive transcriptional regulator